jgi:hypothetical protein
MTQTNIFQQANLANLSERLDKLSQNRKPDWGKMNASQMLAHLNVMFELGLEEKHQPPNALLRFMLRAFVKNKVIGDKPYAKGSRTAPEMLIRHQPSFQAEKKRLTNYLVSLGEKGSTYFEQRAHLSFGKLSATEWSNLFYKHIDHHFKQFGI